MNNHTRTCPHCEAGFTPSRGTQKYCTPICQRRAEKARANARKRESLPPKQCKNCGTILSARNREYCGTPECVRTSPLTCAKCQKDKQPEDFSRDKGRSNGYHQYCKPCARELSAIRYRKRNGLPEDYKAPTEWSIKDKAATCEHCGHAFKWKTHKAKYCSQRCSGKAIGYQHQPGTKPKPAIQVQIKQCANCKKLFITHSAKLLNCSSECINEWQKQQVRKRRARMYSAKYVVFSYREVFERDEWECGICSEPIDPELEYPDGGSVSLDHVIPISRGGTHTPGNAQAAHLRCNLSKGNRMEKPSKASQMAH